MVDEVSPNIRYCAYNIGDESAIAELKEMRRKGGEDQLTSHLDVSYQTLVLMLFIKLSYWEKNTFM